ERGARRNDPQGSHGAQAPAGRGPSGPALNLRSPAHRTERELLKLALQRPELVSPAFDAYGSDEFTAQPYAAVRRAIEDAGGAEQGVGAAFEYLARVRDAAPNDAVRAMVTELAVEVFHGKTIDETYAGEQLVQVRLRAVDLRIRDVTGTLTRLGTHSDPEHYAAVQNELWVLQQYGQSLRNQGAAAL
ncbi:DNA primase, partial [Streptomyces sp. SID3212]|nr:DNA primase [Streptomyces sp. SID3212]